MISSVQKKSYEIYDTMPDEEVVELARSGNEVALEYLINKYKNFVRAKARSYFLIGADREDIIHWSLQSDQRFSSRKTHFVSCLCGTMHHTPDYYGNQNSNKTKTYSPQFLCFVKQTNL